MISRHWGIEKKMFFARDFNGTSSLLRQGGSACQKIREKPSKDRMLLIALHLANLELIIYMLVCFIEIDPILGCRVGESNRGLQRVAIIWSFYIEIHNPSLQRRWYRFDRKAHIMEWKLLRQRVVIANVVANNEIWERAQYFCLAVKWALKGRLSGPGGCARLHWWFSVHVNGVTVKVRVLNCVVGPSWFLSASLKGHR
jgi:hypothetical protein